MTALTEVQKKSFDLHYRENFQKVYRLGYSLSGNRHDAEEIAQEAFLQAYQAFASFKGESQFFTWIYRIALNIASGRMKRRKKQPFLVYTEDLGYDLDELMSRKLPDDPESKILANELKFKCLHCITELLPSLERKVFCLVAALDIPYRQIAEILQCSVGAVKTAICRARKKWVSVMNGRCECFNPENPCRCSGWTSLLKEKSAFRKDVLSRPHPPVNIELSRDVGKLCNLRATYQTMYSDEAPQKLVERIRKGIVEKEWKFLSETV